jgi:hypothetical protein
MTRSRITLFLTAIVAATQVLVADVRSDEKTKVEFAGMLGRIVNIFGGKAAREGVTTTVIVKGDRKVTMDGDNGKIIDLSEEKVYDLDLHKKTYKVTTFAELRRRMEEAQKRAEERASKEPAAEAPPRQNPDEKQIEFDVDVKNTGQTRTINGFDTRETVVTITLREKGKTVEQGGGLIVTMDSWLGPKIRAMTEVADFDMRYAQKLYGGMLVGVSPEQMAAAMAMYPMMKPALARSSAEGGKLDGTAILSTMTMEGVKSDAEMASQEKQAKQSEENSKPNLGGGVGGLLGGLAKKAAAKKVGGDDAPKQRSAFMTTTTEILKVATDVAAADVAVPPGFKETK